MPLVMSKIFSWRDAFAVEPDRVTMATCNYDHTNADTPKGLAQTCVERCIAADVSHQADGCEDEDREACNTADMMVKNGLSSAKLNSLSEKSEQACIHLCIAGHICACECLCV
jgi:hypothetical protein